MNRIFRGINPKTKTPSARTTFSILAHFLVTFITLRVLIYAMVYGALPDFYIIIKGVHVHHLNIGIIILALAGYAALVNTSKAWHGKISALYGIGLAFTFDEFGMWLFLRNDYWVRQSYDAIIIITIIFLNIIYFQKLWRNVFRRILIFWNIVSQKKEEEELAEEIV